MRRFMGGSNETMDLQDAKQLNIVNVVIETCPKPLSRPGLLKVFKRRKIMCPQYCQKFDDLRLDFYGFTFLGSPLFRAMKTYFQRIECGIERQFKHISIATI